MRIVGNSLSTELTPGTVLVFGRDSTCNVPLTSYQFPLHISRTHACITVDSGKIIVRDLKSANGVFISGKRIGFDPVIWEHGDLEIGTCGEFIYKLEGGDDLDEIEKQLRETVEAAKLRKRKFMNISKPCAKADLERFFKSLEMITSKSARRFFLSLVGLTPDFVNFADSKSIEMAASNLGIASHALLSFIED